MPDLVKRQKEENKWRTLLAESIEEDRKRAQQEQEQRRRQEAIFQAQQTQQAQTLVRGQTDFAQERRMAEAAPTAPRSFPVMTPEERQATEQSLLETRARRAGNEAERLSFPGVGNAAASPTAWMTTAPEDTRRYWQLTQENQALDRQAAQMSTRLNLSEIGAWKQEQGKQYEGIRENPDYAVLSQPDERKTIRGLTLARTTGPLSIYNYINDLNGYKDRMKNGPDRGEPLRKYDFLTPKERADYNYVSNHQGVDAGRAYLEYLDYDLNARMTRAAEQEARLRASASPVGASALSVAQNLAAGAGIVSGVAQGVRKAFTGQPVDYNTAAFLPSRLSTATREQVAADIEKAHPNATAAGVNVLSFLYQTGMSMADSGAIAALSVLGVPGATALLGGSAATSAALDVKERGGSDLQALSYGLAAGFAEGLFENVSLEKLIHPKTADGLRGVLMNYARQAFTEGSEEFFTTLANTLTDSIINGDKSELLAKQRQLALNNPDMAEEDARRQAWKEWGISLAADVAAGLISGLLMGGVSSSINFLSETNLRRTGQAMRALGVTNADVQDALLAAMNGARDAQSRAWLSGMADRAAQGEDLARKLPLADLGRVFALRAELGTDRISETAYRQAERNAARPYLNAEAERDAAAPALTLPTTEEQTDRRTDPLGYALDKARRGEALSGGDARTIMNDPQAMQILRDAGVLTGQVRTGRDGRAQVQAAVTAMAAQRTQEAATAAPAAQEAVSAQRRAETAPTAETQQRGAERAAEAGAEAKRPGLVLPTADSQGLTEGAEAGYTEEAPRLRLPTVEEQAAARDLRAELAEELLPLNSATQEQSVAVLDRLYDRNEVTEALRNDGLLTQEDIQNRSPGAMLRAAVNYAKGVANNGQGQETGQRTAAADAGGQQGADGAADIRSREPGRSRTGGGSQRKNRVGSGGQSFSQRVEQIRQTWQRQEDAGRLRSTLAPLRDGEGVSTASLGISNGTERAGVYVIPDRTDARTEKVLAPFREAQREMAARGVRVVPFLGTLEMEDEDGSTYRARGAISEDGKTIWVQMDHASLTWQQILAHEDFHERVKNDKALLRDVAAAFDRDFTEEERKAIINDYFDTYGYFGVSEAYVMEEVLADYFAGIDIYAGTENAQKDIQARSRNVRETVGSRGEARSEEASEEAGGETRASRETDTPYNRTALLTEDTVDRWLKDYASKSSPKYAQAYITRMSPDQFLKLTTSRTGRLAVSSQTGPMDAEKLIEATRQQPLQLRISGGEVVGHEGRHRATALSRADVRSIPVLVFDSSNKNSKTDVPEMVLQGQDFGSSRSYDRVTLENLTPLSYENREKIIRDYGAQDAFERSTEKLGYRQTMRFSRETDAAYLAAVEAGDMDTAQRMVDEAAERAFSDSAVRDEDGKLLMVYHGGEKNYTVFDRTKGRSNMDIQGTFFTPWELDAQGYGSNVRRFFLNLINPADESTGYRALNRYKGQNGAGIKGREYLVARGYDGVDNGGEEYIAFTSEQIKSADPVSYDDAGNVIPLSERFNPEEQDIRYSRDIPGETEELRAENEALKDRLAYWQSQVKPSDRTQPREEDVRRVARDLLKSYESGADRETVTAALRELAHTVMSVDVRWTDVRDQAMRLAGTIIENARTLAGGEEAKLHRKIRAAIRSQKIAFSEQANIPDYNQWRRANFGKLTISQDGVPVDTRWQELQATYGEGYFPAEIDNQTDQVLYLAELWDRLRDVYENPYSADLAEATQYLANDLIDRVLGEEIRQAPTTYADRAQTRIAREALKGELRVEKVKALLDAERERRRHQVENLKEHYKAKEAKSRESRKARELRTKITKHARKMTEELLHPTDKRHIPDQLGKGVAAVLSAIDLGSGYSLYYDREGNFRRVERGAELGAEETKRTQAFLAVRAALREVAEGAVLDNDLLAEDAPSGLIRLVTDLADKPIVNMNSEELQVVYDVLRGVENAVNTWNKLLSQSRLATVSGAADALRSDNAGKQAPLELAGYLGRVQRLTRLDMLTPEAFFHRLGKAGQAIFKLLRGAQDAFTVYMQDAVDDTRRIIGDMNTGALEREQHKVTMGGEEVTMTTAQIMELYCLMQRDQGMQHIMTGGILIDPVRQGVKQTTQAEPLHPSLGELADAVKLLTAEQIRVADALQQYLSVDMAELGNEATLAVYGYKKFGQEEKYWKIRSNKNELQQSIEKETQTTSVANRGFTKPVNPRADTSVRIGSIFDTYSQSVTDMATYAAWLAVGEDVNRIRNYVWRDAEGQRAGTVKDILDRVHGSGGANYLQRLLADIANGAGMDDAGLTSGFVGAFKAAAIGANIRVIVQQPTAILRAAEMISPKYLAAGLTRNPMKAFERAKKYSPIAQWKDWGYFDINTGRRMKDVLFENSSKLEKLRQLSMALAGKADSFAWGQLWAAVEAETKAKTDLAPGTEAFYHACAERFNDIIDHTQVVDGILQRSQIMRSKDGITRMAVSFMSEPTKQYNQFMSAVYDLRHSSSPAETKAAKQHMARTVFSMLAAGIANVLAQSVIDALRDDDREKKYWEKLLQKFLGYNPEDDTFGKKFKTFAFSNMGELINPASYLPFAKDIMSIMQGYSVDRMDMDAISDTVTAMTRAYKALNGEGKQTAGYTLVKLAEQASKLLGLPLYNVDRDLTSLYTTIVNDAELPLLQYYLNRYRYKPLESGNLSAALKGILWDAKQKGDGSYDIIVGKLLKDGYSQETIDKAMLERMEDESGYTAAVKAADAAGNANKSYDSAEKLEAIRSLDIPEEDREELLEAKLSETQKAVYDAFREAEMTFEDYTKAWDAIYVLKPRPGKSTVSDSQKWQAVVHTVSGQLNQDKVLRAFMSEDQEAKYDAAYQAGISPAMYADFKAETEAMTADKDSSGKTISGSKKAKVVSYINGLRLTDEQKDVLYFDAGYSQSTMEKDAPWHSGGGGGGSGVYAPARLPTLRLPTVKDVENRPVRGLRLPTA